MNRHARTAVIERPREDGRRPLMFAMNIALLAVAAVLLTGIIVLANQFAGSQVAIESLQADIRELREAQHSVGALRAEREHPAVIEAHAHERGMVVASDASYVSLPDAGIAGR